MVWRARQGAGGTQLQILRQGHWATTLPGSPRGLASHQAVYPAQPDAAHSMCQCRHLLLTQQRAAVPDTPADGDQTPRLMAPHHPARSHRKPRNTDPGPWPGTLRTGPRGHCSKDGSGTPTLDPQGPRHKLQVSHPGHISAPEVTGTFLLLKPQFLHL